MKNKIGLAILILGSLSGCSAFYGESKTTSYPNDACKMFKENPDWLESTLDSYEKWGTPVSIQLAIIRQESSFRHDARPVRKNKWYEFGTNYASSAYGYSQALDGTWDHYKDSTNQILKQRESFKDATDFIGWYNKTSQKKNNIGRKNSYHLYLAYHEGWGGYNRKSYKSKSFLKKAAANVEKWSYTYSKQLNKCKISR